MKSTECLLCCYKQHMFLFFTYHDYVFMQSVKILHFSRTHCKLPHFNIFGPDSRGIVIASCIRVLTGYQNIRRSRKLSLKNKQKKNESKVQINMQWNLPAILLLSGWEQFPALSKILMSLYNHSLPAISDSDDTYPRLDIWTTWSNDMKQFFSNGAH